MCDRYLSIPGRKSQLQRNDQLACFVESAIACCGYAWIRR